jgi:hypothetical protein
MSSKQYVDYYVNQAGSGIAAYSGTRYQKGNGFFGRIITSLIPVLKSAGKFFAKKALKTGVNIGSDLLGGENFKISVKKRLKSTGLELAEDALDRIRNMKQSGEGMKRRKKSQKNNSKKVSRKRKLSVLQLRALAEGRKSLKRRRALKFKSKKRKTSPSVLF